jgi:glycosyltransferase involved in cell wall biosynthesis
MQKIIRVLHVLYSLDRGGLESRTMDIYRNINREIVQFDFAVHCGSGYFEEEVLRLGGRVFCFNPLTPFNIYRYRAQWDKFLDSHAEYNIVHCHLTSYANILLKIFIKHNISCRIIHARSSGFDSILKRYVVNSINRGFEDKATHLLAVSKLAATSTYSQLQRNAHKIRVVKNGISVEKYKFNAEMRNCIRNQLGIGDKLVIGHVGRFHISKNHKFILDIFNEILIKDETAVLLLVGDGELKNSMRLLSRNMGIENSVIFAGTVSNVEDYLSAMDVFIFPSFYEGLPGSVIEAQASGLQCYVSKSITEEIAITDLVHRIDLGSAALWANRILGPNEGQREGKYLELITAGFDALSVAKEYESIYMSAQHV